MAVTYLNEGATSDAAANWSDTIGYANAATLVVGHIPMGQTISSGLSYPAVSIASLDIRYPFSGSYGSGSAGALTLDADGGSPNTINYDAKAGSFYLKAGGGDALITNYNHTSAGTSYLQGGTFTTTGQHRGTLNANASTIMTTLGVFGGTTFVDTNATAFTLLEIIAGNVTIKRHATTITVAGGALFRTDGTGTTTTVNMYGGYLEWAVGTITTLNYYGGEINFANGGRDVTLTNFNVYPSANPSAVRAIASTVTATPTYKYGGPTVRQTLSTRLRAAVA